MKKKPLRSVAEQAANRNWNETPRKIEQTRILNNRFEKAGESRPHLRVEDMIERFGVSDHCLSRWRMEGKGPRFLRIGKYIFYPWAEVEKWEAQHLKAHTGE